MKFKALSLVAALIVSAGACVSAQEAELPKTLTLEKALEYAMENHSSIIAARSNVAQYEAQTKEAKDHYLKNRYNSFANGMATFNDALVKNGVMYFSANASLEIANATEEQTKYGVKTGVETSYFSYINAVKKSEATKSALESASQRYENEATEKELGMSSEYELMVAENTLLRTRSDHNAAVRAVNAALAKLKTAVGLPISAETAFVTTKMDFPEIPDITVEEATELAKENNISIKSSRLQLEVQEATFKATSSWYAKNTYAYKNAEAALEYAKDSYANALAQAEMGVYTAHDNMIAAVENAEIINNSVVLAEKTYEINQKKYEIGLIAKLDLDESWYEMETLKIQQAEVGNAVFGAIKQFEMSYSY